MSAADVAMDPFGGSIGCEAGTDGLVYSVVVPVYNEETNVQEVVERVCAVMDQVGEPYELLFVDDGSTDDTPRLLRELASSKSQVRAVRLARNFGQEAAVQASYLYARGQWLIQMDGDLQNPPEEIPKLLALQEDGYDIVFGVRTGRKDPLFRKLASSGMRWVMRSMLHIELPEDISTFRLMRGTTAKALARFPERQKFLSALACWMGARYTSVNVEHAARASGRTKYNLAKLVNHTFDLVVGFSSRPLRMIGLLGLLAAIAGFGFATWAVVQKLVWGTRMGWSSTFAGIMGMGGMQLLALSLIGEYVARIFVQTQQRPIFIAAEQWGLPERSPEQTRHDSVPKEIAP